MIGKIISHKANYESNHELHELDHETTNYTNFLELSVEAGSRRRPGRQALTDTNYMTNFLFFGLFACTNGIR